MKEIFKKSTVAAVLLAFGAAALTGCTTVIVTDQPSADQTASQTVTTAGGMSAPGSDAPNGNASEEQSRAAENPEGDGRDSSPPNREGFVADTDFYTVTENVNGDAAVTMYDSVVYVADGTGVWKKTTGSNEKIYLTNNPAVSISTDGTTVLYVNKKHEAQPAAFSELNSEIHMIGADGSNDTALTEVSGSAQSICIYNNKLYYVDWLAQDSFQRGVFALDLNSGEKTTMAYDVGYPKTYMNLVFYTESGALEGTVDGAKKVFDVKSGEVTDSTNTSYSDWTQVAFNNGAVIKLDDGYYYGNGLHGNIKIENISEESEIPLYFFDGILYYKAIASSVVDMR